MPEVSKLLAQARSYVKQGDKETANKPYDQLSYQSALDIYYQLVSFLIHDKALRDYDTTTELSTGY
jgi:hypothetical protein